MNYEYKAEGYKISELIEELNGIKESFGDLRVHISVDRQEYDDSSTFTGLAQLLMVSHGRVIINGDER